jgi:hypothetical protein
MKIRISLLVAGCLVFASLPALAQTPIQINTRITVKAKPSSLHGKVVAPAATGTLDEKCEKNRKIEVFMKKPSGFKRIARVTSKADGSWSARAPKEKKVYKITLVKKAFSDSTAYGTLKDVVCAAKTVKGKKVTSTRFKIL